MKIVAWIVGLVAFIFYILSVQKSEKDKLLIFQLIANVLYSVQYVLLGVFLAALMNFISVARIAVFYKYNKEGKNIPLYSLIIFIVLILSVGMIRYDSHETIDILAISISLIPIVITLLYTISTWKNNMNVIRIVFIVCSVLWMFYNFKVGAYTSLLGNVFEFSSGVVSLIRYKKAK